MNEVGSSDECILITTGLVNGYVFSSRGRSLSREWWIKAHGPITAGLRISHTCGHKNCINSNHFVLKTYDEIMLKKVRDNPQSVCHGEKNGRCKLNRARVSQLLIEFEIRTALLQKRSHIIKSLADDFQISKPIIHQVLNGKHWSQVK